MKNRLKYAAFSKPVAPTFPDITFDIRDYGVVEGGEVQVTAAIRAAIEDCSKKGGGRVVVPKGRWLTGPIHLRDNVELHFAEGASSMLEAVVMYPVYNGTLLAAGSLMAWLCFSEKPSRNSIIGVILVFAAVVLAGM